MQGEGKSTCLLFMEEAAAHSYLKVLWLPSCLCGLTRVLLAQPEDTTPLGPTNLCLLPLQTVGQRGLNVKDYQVAAMTLASAFDFVKSDEVNFRFVPSMDEVRAAGLLYKEAGVKLKHLRGVPVFQAEGLYISQDDQVPAVLGAVASVA